jgi:carboxymethylenebutenolidase
MQRIDIKTADGTCPSYEFTPPAQHKAPWPAVLFYMDGIGIRPALFAMGERMASYGYYVLLPDLFYRGGPYEPVDPAKLFGDPEFRAQWAKTRMGIAGLDQVMRDTQSFLAHIDAQPNVRSPKIGVTGYCMGGRMSMVAAATFPDRVGVSLAFHPGGLATDAPDSPHLLVPKIQCPVYVGGATEDANFTVEQQERLKKAFADAGKSLELEIYPAKHGWVPSDTPVHDPAQAERHWAKLSSLFSQM